MSDELDKKKEIISASPKVRKLARELGANIYQIQGSQREGRISEEDVKSFIKESISGQVEKKQPSTIEQYNHSEFGQVEIAKNCLIKLCSEPGSDEQPDSISENFSENIV